MKVTSSLGPRRPLSGFDCAAGNPPFIRNQHFAGAVQIYLHHGDIGAGTDNHAFNLGLRLPW